MTAISIRQRLDAGETIVFCWALYPGIHQADAMARTGFEGVLVDMQHGLNDYTDMVQMIMAVNAAGKPAFVRPPLGDYGTVSRALDAGAAAVIAPMINSVEDARKLAAAAKYPPTGERSWGPVRALPASGLSPSDYQGRADKMSLTFAMIETQAAIDAVDEICATPGIDGIFVGPYDLSVSLGNGAAANPEAEAVEEILPVLVKAAARAGIVPGIYASTPAQVAKYRKIGFRFISGGSDSSIIATGAESLLGIGKGTRDLP